MTARTLVLLIGSICVVNTAFAACDPKLECPAGNLCYGNGGISCRQGQQCSVKNGQASWGPIQGGGTICGAPFKITVLEATTIAVDDPKLTRDFTTKIEARCKETGGEVCSFKIKNPGGELGDPIPGHHVTLRIRYICRSATESRGPVKVEFSNDEGDANFNCVD